MQSTLAKKTFDETTTKRAFELVGSRADSILNKKLVAAMIGVSVSTLDRMVKAGTSAAGAHVFIGATKIEGASGGPARLLALW
jgi:hypothetical protein